MDPFVSLEDHEPLGSESKKGCGASEVLHTHTNVHNYTDNELNYRGMNSRKAAGHESPR